MEKDTFLGMFLIASIVLFYLFAFAFKSVTAVVLAVVYTMFISVILIYKTKL